MAYLRYAVCGCCLCIKNANCYILGEDVKWCGGCARRRGADFILSVKWLCAPRGAERSFIKANYSLLMSKENQKTTSDFDALDPRERGYSPLSDPEGEVEVEKC